MRERPISFSPEMAQAILDGRKTQTRRVIKSQPDECIWFGVRPTPYRHVINPQQPNVVHKNIIKCPYGKVGDSLWVRETWTINSIFMPREASRITLEITNIRVERLQAISARDVIAEGVWDKTHTLGDFNWQREWIEKWDSINKKRGYDWNSNPWVWVIEFVKH